MRFVNEIKKSLPSVFPDNQDVVNNKQVSKLINDAIDKANEYKIGLPRDIALFVYIYIEYGPDFPVNSSTQWMEKILRNEELSSDVKMDIIYQRLKIITQE
jgi:hypothetical protein